jgi:hypothetical protein
MPGIKSSIYDGAVYLNGDVLDLSGTTGTLINLAAGYPAGTKVFAVDGGTSNLSVGDKVINGGTGKALGIIKTVDSSTQITLERPSLNSVSNNDPINIAPKYEIVAIQTLNPDSGGACDIDILWPANTKWPGTHNPGGLTWSSNTLADFGAVSGDGSAFHIGEPLPGGTTIEGRWTKVSVTEEAICYLKAVPTQTF